MPDLPVPRGPRRPAPGPGAPPPGAPRRRRSRWTLAAAGAIALLAVAAILTAVLRGGGPSPPPPPPPRAPRPSQPSPPPAPPPLTPLNVGITEANPHLIAPGSQPSAFAPWRDRLAALRPRYLRVLIDWRRVQPSPDRPPDWSVPADGCLRGIPPCAPYGGIADELRAARAAGMVPVVTFLDTPDWAASPPSGCDRTHPTAQARMPADLEAYRALVRSLLDLGRREGVDLSWWSAWNEPNNATFLAPQRERCDPGSPTLAAGEYARLVRAMKAELDAAPGDQRIVLGETAGVTHPKPGATGAAELAGALPDDVVCDADVWAQHAYVRVHGALAGDPARDPGHAEMLRDVERGLDAHGCDGEPLPIWVTETGAEPGDGRAGCVGMARALAGWYDDPRVDAAFQYTFREDTLFRTGLADERLTHERPSYAAWRALAAGGRSALDDPRAACAGGAADAADR